MSLRAVIIIFIGLLFSQKLYAQETITKSYNPDDLEIDGLIVDETRSKVGKDFYDLFYTNWVAPFGAKNFTIFIEEKPMPRAGTQIIVKLNDEEILKQFVQPRYDVIEQISTYAVQRTKNYLQNYGEIKKQLQGEDLSGSGIY